MATNHENIFVYWEPRKRVWWLQLSFSPLHGEANGAHRNPLAGFEGPLRGGERRERKEGREKKRKERVERDGRKHPSLRSKFLVAALVMNDLNNACRVTLQRTKWLIISVAALSGVVSSASSRPFSLSSPSSAAATATATASVKPPPARSLSAAADDRDCRGQRPVVIIVVVDVVASRTRTSQLRSATAAGRRRPAATRQRRAHRGCGARRQRHADHCNVHSSDARVGRRTNRTHCVRGALTQLPSLPSHDTHVQGFVQGEPKSRTIFRSSQLLFMMM